MKKIFVQAIFGASLALILQGCSTGEMEGRSSKASSSDPGVGQAQGNSNNNNSDDAKNGKDNLDVPVCATLVDAKGNFLPDTTGICKCLGDGSSSKTIKIEGSASGETSGSASGAADGIAGGLGSILGAGAAAGSAQGKAAGQASGQAKGSIEIKSNSSVKGC